MEKRFQVFVSSTYTDLKDERKSVTQTLMEMDCIPAGMELFPAADEEQWEFIKKVIDDSDYYLLIVGGRYGSLGTEGLSYTEMEFDYAVEKGIKVVALLHGSPEKLTIDKSEISEGARLKLQAFRDKVSKGRLVKYWVSSSELPGLVSLSLVKTIKSFPAVGWVRASEGSNEELLKEINELRKENERLKTKLEVELDNSVKNIAYDLLDLAGFDCDYCVHGTSWNGVSTSSWGVSFSWGKIFYFISPYLKARQKESVVKLALLRAACDVVKFDPDMSDMDDQDFQTVAIQLQALGVVEVFSLDSAGDAVEPMWKLTKEGERLMVESRAIKRGDA